VPIAKALSASASKETGISSSPEKIIFPPTAVDRQKKGGESITECEF